MAENKRRSMKKHATLKVFFMLVTMTALCVTLVGCDFFNALFGNYSETFAGSLSEASYESEERAAQAFLGEEIGSAETSVTYKSGTKEKTLSDKEAESLAITVEEGKVERVEKWKVNYTQAMSSRTATIADTEKELCVTVYIVVIKITPAGMEKEVYEYRYFVPLPENGEAISASYYDSVFDSEKYENCTVSIQSVSTSKSQTASMSIAFDYTIKIADDAVQLIIDTNMTATENGIRQSEKASAVIYFKKALGVLGVSYQNGVYAPFYGASSGISDLEDLYQFNMDTVYYLFFEKTSYGFKMTEEKLQDLLDDALSQFGAQTAGMTIGKTKARYEFYVSEGRLDHADYEVSVGMTYAGEKLDSVTKQTYSYGDFGKTVVNIPAEAENYFYGG